MPTNHRILDLLRRYRTPLENLIDGLVDDGISRRDLGATAACSDCRCHFSAASALPKRAEF
ncbi:MAG: hypothetical protein EOS41_27720 [Mesorhizobium sp.]|uniref:hypothetical protein n=1 Tax=Mesorhizobium sp. TaxID=1871066 RepID=UPI000FEA85F2|nr:hypothetical protein [Mesorhizobium sp.]RWE20899.1 MAG: hypothetical protein EOS41_27720 [Mesorhizobium sp.]